MFFVQYLEHLSRYMKDYCKSYFYLLVVRKLLFFRHLVTL